MTSTNVILRLRGVVMLGTLVSCFALVDRPPFRPAQKRHRSRFISEPGPMPGNGPGSSGNGNGPGSCGATVPVVATNRDQCSGDQHVAHCEALVPVIGKNRDCCPGYISPQPALCHFASKNFRIVLGWGGC